MIPNWRASFGLAIGAVTIVAFTGIEWVHTQQSSVTLAAVLESAPIPPDKILQYIQDVVHAPDRSIADKSLDAGRQPDQMLAFLVIQPGMKVADLFAGNGYTTELLARVVEPSGTVYSQNPPFPPNSSKSSRHGLKSSRTQC